MIPHDYLDIRAQVRRNLDNYLHEDAAVADWAALRDDWLTVGADLRKAMAAFEDTLTPEQRAQLEELRGVAPPSDK